LDITQQQAHAQTPATGPEHGKGGYAACSVLIKSGLKVSEKWEGLRMEPFFMAFYSLFSIANNGKQRHSCRYHLKAVFL
jgi:hypothetical protein